MSTITLQPAQDHWITNTFDYSSNYGVTNSVLKVGGWGDQYFALLGFDLSTINATQVSSATLNLYNLDANGGTPTSLYVDELNTAWGSTFGWYDYGVSPHNGGAITSLPPNFDFTNLGTVTVTGTGSVSIDITETVNEWLANPSSNFGVQLRPQSNNNNFDEFASSNAGSQASLQPQLVIQTAAGPSVYSISPSPTTINENAGTFTFTITRSDSSSASTVFVSTVHDQGIDNPNSNTYYQGILNQQINFAAGQSTTQVQLTVNDLHLTSGSETFRLIVQQNSSDPFTTSLASDTFTIVNNDTPASTYSISPVSPSFNENAGTEAFTITRSSGSSADTVFVSTVQDQGYINNNYYTGITDQQINFAIGQTSAQVQLSVHDLGLTSGSETFSLIVQQHSNDPFTTSLASDTFTIVNNDAPPDVINQLSPDQQLELIYLGYFNRPADSGGLQFWSGQNISAQAAGQSPAVALTNIANSFTPQPETVALYPFLSNPNPNYTDPTVQAGLGTFIQNVYSDIFSHAADSGGLSYWTGQIESGAVGLGAAVLAIANGAIGADASTLLNKTATAFQVTNKLWEYYNASNAVYGDNAVGTSSGAVPSSQIGLTLLLDSRDASLSGNGNWLSDGFFAQAFTDMSGKIIIAFEGTSPNPLESPYARGTLLADANILIGLKPQAFVDAETFAADVIQYQHSHAALASDQIYLTGHSLGGAEAEAEDVATMVFGHTVGGFTFGAPGQLLSPTVSDPNLIDYVDYGDPVGNFGNHVGTVQPVGSFANKIVLTFAEIATWETSGLPLGALVGVDLYHLLPHYASDFTNSMQLNANGYATPIIGVGGGASHIIAA